MKKIFIGFVLVLLSTSLFAQSVNPRITKKPVAKKEDNLQKTAPETTSVAAAVSVAKQVDRPMDGYYKKSSILQAKVTPLANIREADVIYSKRIWREIDVREKMNQFFVAPQSSLINIIKRAVEAGELTAYDPTPAPEKDDSNGDAFSTPLSVQKAVAVFNDSTLVPDFNEMGEKIGDHMVANLFTPEVYANFNFRIKEDWIFDKQRSVFEPRIIGLAILRKNIVNGEDQGQNVLFWLYFPELRNILVTQKVANNHNDAANLSYDDIFMKRIFSSYIVKVSNVKDQFIRDYITTSGVDRLKESERLKKELLDWEHDLWSY
ncbi:MAG: gliding motility protein GldN [Sphingobacteriaceae bacterium]